MASLALAFDILARDRASREFAKVGDAADRAGKKGGGFGDAMKKAAGVAAAAFATLGAIDFFKDSIAEARESQKVGALTAQVIKSTGGVAKISAEQVGELATAISNKTGVDDEAIQSGANLLLTFKNVRNEVGKGANIFDRATQAAADLSAAGFGDMATTSKQLGKALNDPVKGITALSRSGVTFTKQQQEQIKTLVASGKTLEAQKIILGEVESQVGGAAEASATAGEKFATTFGNFKEAIGTALLPLLDQVLTVGQGVVSWATQNLGPALAKVGDFFKPLIDAVKVFFTALSGNSEADEFDGTLKTINNAGIAVREVFDKIVAAVKNLIAEWANGTGAGGKIRQVFENIVRIGKSVGGVLVEIGKKAFEAVKGFITDWGKGEGAAGKLRDALATAGDVIRNVTKWLADNETVVKSVTVAVLAGFAAWKTFSTIKAIITGIQGALAAFRVGILAMNAAMAANPIGIIVVALAALAAGLVYAYNTSETFRDIVDKVFTVVKIGALTLAKVAVTAFQFLANVWLTVVGVIIDAAANAFGWVPGLGDKLKGAQKSFHAFKDGVNSQLDQIKKDIEVNIATEKAKLGIDALYRDFINKNWTVQVQVRGIASSGNSNKGRALIGMEARAGGGPVRAGRPYLVGEAGMEVFVPDVSGTVVPNGQTRRMLSSASEVRGGGDTFHITTVDPLAAAVEVQRRQAFAREAR